MACKRKQTDLIGYVNQIYPCKQKSFRMTLQVRNKSVRKAICFDMKKLPLIKRKHDSCEPLKFVNVMIQEPANSNYAEILINSSTSIVEPQPGDVKFEHEEPVLQTTKLSEIDLNMSNDLASQSKTVHQTRISARLSP